MKKLLIPFLITLALIFTTQYFFVSKKSNENPIHSKISINTNASNEEEEHELQIPGKPDKSHRWTPEESAKHQALLANKIASKNEPSAMGGGSPAWADGNLKGSWTARGPYNQPGCWEFSEFDESDNTIWSVTCSHYGKVQFIFRGSLQGDDFQLINAQFPNEFNNLFAITMNNSRRIVADINNAGIAWSEDLSNQWNLSQGISDIVVSSTVNRQDSNKVYAATKNAVYKSTDGAQNFQLLQSFSGSKSSAIYSPRYNFQPGFQNIFLAREGSFYTFNSATSTFDLTGTFAWPGTDKHFNIGGDLRRLYINTDKSFFTSTDSGKTWNSISAQYTNYSGSSATFSAGKILGVNPQDPEIVLGGYLNPLLSWNHLQTITERNYWARHQVASAPTPDDRHRTRIHADNQSVQFFMNHAGELFTVHNSDGGVYISTNEWKNQSLPTSGDYGDSVYFNLTLFGVQSTETYPSALLTGARNPDHIVMGTQDQGTQTNKKLGGTLLNFVQSPYGDGPHLVSADGENAWTYSYTANKVYPPFAMYDNLENFTGAKQKNTSISDTLNPGGWYFHNAVVDLSAPTGRLWILSKKLVTVEYSQGSLSHFYTDFGGSNYIGALAQSKQNPDFISVIENGVVYISSDHGSNWNTGTNTGITSGSSGWDRCGAWISPTDLSKMLFSCPSNSSVVSVFSSDSGKTWSDVSGIFPNVDVNGMVGSPDGSYIFASTDMGPYVFSVATQTWYDLAGSSTPWFNGRMVEFIESENIVRFSSWGSGIWDFQMDFATPFIKIHGISAEQQIPADTSVSISWNTNATDSLDLFLQCENQSSTLIQTLSPNASSFQWNIPVDQAYGKQCILTMENQSRTLRDSSEVFSLIPKVQLLASSHLTLESFDSEHSGKEAIYVLDDDPNTFWHSEWQGTVPDYPHDLIFSSDTLVDLAALSYLPRQDGSTNGRIDSVAVYLSQDGVNWGTPVVVSSLADNSSLKTIFFDTVMSVSWIRFSALSEVNDNKYASAAEIDLYYIPDVPAQSSSSSLSSSSSSILSSSSMLSSSSEGTVQVFFNQKNLNGKLLKTTVFDMTGKIVQHDLQSLPAGIWLIRREFTNGNTRMNRIIVQ